jgi:hypothetical protein
MKYSGLFVAGVDLIAVMAGAPVAQSGTTGNGSKQRIAAAVTQCLAMPHDQMMKDQGCKSLMIAHPELFPGNVVP